MPGNSPAAISFLTGMDLYLYKESAMTFDPETHNHGALPAGTLAPDFTLNSSPTDKLTLSDLRGQPVILAFYPADFSPVCGDQMALYNEILPEFHRYNAQLLGISVDGRWCHMAFSENRHLHFPLLADFEPKGAVSKAYDVYDAEAGTSKRALFVLDDAGVITWSYISPNSVNPGADGILRALDALPAKETAPR